MRNSAIAPVAAGLPDAFVRRHPRHRDAPRSEMAVAFVLSLLLHGLVFLALFDLERPAAESARAMVVSVRLMPAQPMAPPAPPPAARAGAVASPSTPKEIHARGSEPVHADAEPAARSASRTRIASAPSAVQVPMRVIAKPAATTPTVPVLPHRAEAPDNRASDSASDYLRLLAMRLAEVKQYPALAAARREEGVVLLAFRLDRGGRVLSWRIARGSGHDDLDAEVSRMVVLAAPFPPFPAAWREAEAEFQVPIGFSLY
ncbi:MAG: TonB family protein [Rudaea sp.]|uniref:TonB family protein n=1 Tax=Rudaea sp. TaxID=2136325 RepID=UPI0039E288B5